MPGISHRACVSIASKCVDVGVSVNNKFRLMTILVLNGKTPCRVERAVENSRLDAVHLRLNLKRGEI